MANQIILDKRPVGKITGDFKIPSYQRGYRWTENEVRRLLEDIWVNGSAPYCLQPIVLCNHDGEYEVIDGQQRLTTIYLIYVYLHTASGGFFAEPKFTLDYENRQQSGDFLKTLDKEREEEYIDFWFMRKAYEEIENWFAEKGAEGELQNTMSNINKYFVENVEVIWYEVGTGENANQLFSRLNIGKIPLTSAELVKAMFLSEDNPDITREKQEEIALQWDNIEHELSNESLWYFLTNDSSSAYQTKIDLILDLMAKKPKDSREKYHTFFYFDEKKKTQKLTEIWKEIQHAFLILKDWYCDHEFYHKIGYLILCKEKSLADIYEMSKDKTKSEFKTQLNLSIKQSVKIEENYADLSYETNADKAKITKLLQLFNVESVRQNGEHTQWFPFDKFKMSGSAKADWSLEHIHAQNSENLRRQEDLREWLKLHVKALKALGNSSTEMATLLAEMEAQLAKKVIDTAKFRELSKQACGYLSDGKDNEYIHTIANLALLNRADNAALNNSTFDVKRSKIIEMDKKGQYIPFCTRMVFLKYYTDAADNQLHFWGEQDRVAYIKGINRVLKEYISPINTGKDDEKDAG